jgi:hypothetical protein
VLALHDSLWVAFDATTCSLYKAWKGDVKLQGAVYDAVHGPQPEVQGTVVLESTNGAWSLWQQSAKIESKPVWKGYRIANNTVTLLYDLQATDGGTIHVEETIDVKDARADRVALARTLRMTSESRDLVPTLALPEYKPGGVSMSRNNDPRSSAQDTTMLLIGDEMQAVAADSITFQPNGQATLLKILDLAPPKIDSDRGPRKGGAP